MENITHKQGTSFQWLFDVVDLLPNQSLVGSVGRSQVRTCNNVLVEELVFTWITDGLQFTIVSPTDTSAWAVGDLFFDVKFYINGQSVASDTGNIAVTKGITE